MSLLILSYKGYNLYSTILDDGRLMVFCEVNSETVVKEIKYVGSNAIGNKNQIKSLIDSIKEGIDLYAR